jgi:tetratricopeptide (TPR) repeat protein
LFGKKYLLLELDPFEAELYHLPDLIPYPKNEQKKLSKEGFNWDHAVSAMKALVKEDDCDEYKRYRLFIKKWDLYKQFTEFSTQGNFKEAEKSINKILAIDLLDPSAYLNLAFCYRSQGEYLKAEQSYVKGLELTKFRAPFLSGLAKTYEEINKFEEAIFNWYQILEEKTNYEAKTIMPYSENYMPVVNEAAEEALEKLIGSKVYKRVAEDVVMTPNKTYIEFAHSSDKAQAIYEREEPDLTSIERRQTIEKLEPDQNFERLMIRSFQKNYNDVEALTKLGVKLVHHQFTKLAVKVFERVYQLSQLEGKKVAPMI